MRTPNFSLLFVAAGPGNQLFTIYIQKADAWPFITKHPLLLYSFNLLAELKNRLKISIFLWRKKLCISLIFSNFVVSNYKVIYFTLCTTCMQIS